jgi:hypothetical protein
MNKFQRWLVRTTYSLSGALWLISLSLAAGLVVGVLAAFTSWLVQP